MEKRRRDAAVRNKFGGEGRREGVNLSFLSVDIANTRPIFRNKTKKAVISHWFPNFKHLALNAYTLMVYKTDTSCCCS